jgi:hypothetical protein
MKPYLLLFCIYLAPHAYGESLSCGQKFDHLEELRVSSFDVATLATSKAECLKGAEKFLKEAGTPPFGCKNAIAIIKDWSDSYQADTQKILPKEPRAAYDAIKVWAYNTLKKKCAQRKFN